MLKSYKTRNRLFSLLLALCLFFSLFGCGGTPEEPSSQPPSQSEQEQSLTPLQEVLRQFPHRLLLDEKIIQIYPVQGAPEGLLYYTASSQLWYWDEEAQRGCRLSESWPDWELTAGMVEPGVLQVVCREGISRWDIDSSIHGTAGAPKEQSVVAPLPEDKRFDFSYNFQRDQLFWVDTVRSDLRYGAWDSEGTVLWESTLGENTGPYPSIDEEGHRVTARASAPTFSKSGKLAFFAEMSGSYEHRPVLYDLETGKYWAAEEPTEAPAVLGRMVGETGVLACYYDNSGDGSQGWNKVAIVTMEGMEEVELDHTYVHPYPGGTGLLLQDDEGDLYRWELDTRRSEMIYKNENPRVYISEAVGTAKFDAILFSEAFTNNRAVAILPREDAAMEAGARTALERLLTCTLDQAAEFEAAALPPGPAGDGTIGIAPAPDGVGRFFEDLLGDCMTGEGIAGVTADRVFGRTMALAREHNADISVSGLELTPRGSTQGLYDFTARLEAPAGTVASALGSVMMVKTGEGWKASQALVKVTEQESAAAVYARKLEFVTDPEDPRLQFRRDTEAPGTAEDIQRCKEIFSLTKDEVGKFLSYTDSFGAGFADNSDEFMAEQLEDILKLYRRTTLYTIREIKEQDPRALTRGVAMGAFYDKDGNRLCLAQWYGHLVWVELADSENVLVFQGQLGVGRAEDSPLLDGILASYYRAPGVPVTDPRSMLGRGERVDDKKLIPIYATDTSGREELLALCEKLKNGGQLHDLMKEDGRWYTVVTDGSGKETNHYAVIDPGDFTVMEYGVRNEFTRREFASAEEVVQLIGHDKLDSGKAKMAHCIITGFASGNLLWDGQEEYFIPADKGYHVEITKLLTVGKVYTVPEIANIIRENIDTIFSFTGGIAVE